MNHRLKEVQEQAQEAINLAKANTKDTAELREKVEKQAEKIDKKMAQTEQDIYEEMNLREEKRRNVVLHGVQEPTGVDGWTRMDEDRKMINKIFTELDVNITVETDVEFCRRVGEKSDKARPLVVGFYTEGAKNLLLRNSRYLMDTGMKNISVGPDLTEKQRRAEREMLAEADRRNQEELTEQDKAKNLSWKVVGRKGQKRLVKVFEREQQRGRGRGGGMWRGRGRGSTARDERTVASVGKTGAVAAHGGRRSRGGERSRKRRRSRKEKEIGGGGEGKKERETTRKRKDSNSKPADEQRGGGGGL
jgi:uncharacterized membrane protein